MTVSRRSFVKSSAAAFALAAAGGTLACALDQLNSPTAWAAEPTITWTHGVCRFCGTGCGVLVGTTNNKVTAVLADPDCESNKGFCCVKGYYLFEALHANDRLTTPLIRDDSTTKGTNQGLREATWEEALNLVSIKLKEARTKGPERIAFWASGQNTIAEGYALSKFWKAGLTSNNIDPNARLCMASAVVALTQVFGSDEPAQCYDDLDLCDTVVTWGANIAEAHPVLYQRFCAHQTKDSNVTHIDVAPCTTRTSRRATEQLTFVPGTDLALGNCICNYIIEQGKVHKEFIEAHTTCMQGPVNLGHAFNDDYDGKEAKDAAKLSPMTFEEFAAALKPYTIEYTSQLTGIPASKIEMLAKIYADPNDKTLTLWTMGVNQHTRGTWMNEILYNIHLLTGKIAQPGCGAFSLTGQPSACGTAREVGTFAHRLPADLVVTDEQHRRFTEAIWKLPEGYLDAIKKPGYHTIKIFRELSKGNIDFLWTSNVNFARSLPNLTRFLGKDGTHTGITNAFVVVNDVFPTKSCEYADVVFPCAFWVEKEGQYGNCERRTNIFEKAVNPPGEARSDLWTFMSVASRVLSEQTIGDQDAFDLLFGEIWDREAGDFKDGEVAANKALFEEYRIFTNPTLLPQAQEIAQNADGREGFHALHMEAKRLAPYDVYRENHGLQWPVHEVEGTWKQTKWRYLDGPIDEGRDGESVRAFGKSGLASGVSFYKAPQGKCKIIFRPYEPPAEVPNDEYPFWLCTGRLLEHWHTGTMTRRIKVLKQAMPTQYLYMNPKDAQRLEFVQGDRIKVSSRHGSYEAVVGIDERFEPAPGALFSPFFDEDTPVNLVVHDYYCPLSKEPDFKKTCVSLARIGS